MEFFTGIMQRITEMNGVLNEMQGDLAKTTEVEDRRQMFGSRLPMPDYNLSQVIQSGWRSLNLSKRSLNPWQKGHKELLGHSF